MTATELQELEGLPLPEAMERVTSRGLSVRYFVMANGGYDVCAEAVWNTVTLYVKDDRVAAARMN